MSKKIKRTNVSLVQTPEPHYIPGYTGYSPGAIYRCADTYGALTHFLLLDPCTNHSEKLVVSNRCSSDYNVERPILTETDLVKKRENIEKRTQRLVPGYTAFIPRTRERFGNRFSVLAAEGLSEFERMMLKKRYDQKSLIIKEPLREVSRKSNYQFPLELLRPDL